MFEIEQSVKLIHVNCRSEIHGDERTPAYDLKFQANCPSDILLEFHPRLRAALFQKPTNPDLADQGAEDALSELVFPLMEPFKYAYECESYHLTVGYGIGGKSDIKLGDVKVDKFKFTPLAGGRVQIDYRCIVHPETKNVGKLGELIQQEVEIKLIPPEPTTVHELFGEKKA